MFELIIIFTFMIMVGVAIISLVVLSVQSYGSQLEQYINSKNPMDIYDVERLTTDFNRKTQQRYL